MKVKLIIISIILLLVIVFACGCIPFMEKLGLVSPTDEEQLSPEKGSPPDGLVKVLIGFKEKPGAAQQAMVRGVGGKIKYTYHIVDAIAASIPEKAIVALQNNPNVTHVELDGEVFAIGETLPWGVDRIDAEEVWTGNNMGQDVKVAIIDSGIDNDHLDLIVKSGENFVSIPSWKTPDPDKWDDDYGHGTHVAGIVAALNNDIGVVGVAPKADLCALKVLDKTGRGNYSDVISALQWCVGNSIQITNNSYGSSGDPGVIVKKAFDDSATAGVLHVAAAGNENGGSVIYPAAYDSVIAVSATDSADKLASFSSVGYKVELAAPGVYIYSTYKDGGYATYSGTSMASPHVAGVAALVINAGISDAEDVRVKLKDTAEDIGLLATEQGNGLVDAAEAVGVGTDTTPPGKVTGLTVTPVSCTQLDLAWEANTVDEDLKHYNVYRSIDFGSSYDLIASPDTNLYLDVGLTASTIYYYVVTAVDNSGNEGVTPDDEASGTTSADDLDPVTSNVVADPNPTNGATPVTLTADVSDTTTGNSNIAAAEYFVDDVGTDGTGTSMIASDGDFDSSIEGVTASIDISGWTVGKNYTLYVHGRDAANNWGTTESVVLNVTEESSNIMYVESIVFSSKVAGPNKFLYTTVKVVDGNVQPLGGVRVEMTLYHQELGDTWFAGDTDVDGMVKFTQKKAPSGHYTATVTALILTDYTWDTIQGVLEASRKLEDDGTVVLPDS